MELSAMETQQRILENQAVLRVLCHDLANPLAIILTATSIAQHSDDLEEIRGCFDKIRRAADEQRRILRLIREAREALSGAGLLELVETDLGEVLERVKFCFSEELHAKNIELTTSLGPKAEQIFADDILFTNLALKTLISNAIKYSNPGSKIALTTKRLDDEVELTVIDSGIGIPEEMQTHLFDLNYRETRPGTQGERGQGLGLALLNIFMKRVGGNVRIESPVGQTGKGTAFHITMPAV